MVLDIQPVQGVQQRQKRVERRGHGFHLGEGLCGTVGLGNLSVRQMLNNLHSIGRVRCPVHRLMDEQPMTTGTHLLYALARPAAKQTVAAA